MMDSVELKFANPDDLAAPLAVARESFIATRCGAPMNAMFAANVQGQSASYHIDMDDGSYINAKFTNWWVNTSGVEVGPGAAATIECYIEYPIFSTPQRVTFGGVNVGNIPDGGEISIDTFNLTRKKGTPFRFLTYRTCSAGLTYHAGGSALQCGEQIQNGATVTNNIANGGTIGGSDIIDYYSPSQITGMTNRRTVAIIGDSIDDGSWDVSSDYWGDTGIIAKSIGRNFAYAKVCVPGDRADWFIASHAKRLAIALLASDVWINYGRNDLAASRSGATVNADILTIAGYFPGTTKLYTRTLAPWASSTDNWMTDANQTASTFNAQVEVVNAARRLRTAPFVYNADVYTILSGRGGYTSMKWKTDLGLTIPKFYTSDGTHPSERGYAAVRDSGLVKLV